MGLKSTEIRYFWVWNFRLLISILLGLKFNVNLKVYSYCVFKINDRARKNQIISNSYVSCQLLISKSNDISFSKFFSDRIDLGGMTCSEKKFCIENFLFSIFWGHAQMYDVSIPVRFYCKHPLEAFSMLCNPGAPHTKLSCFYWLDRFRQASVTWDKQK